MELKVEAMSREVIKPALPVLHDDHLPLSFMDFNMLPVYVPLIFFYKLEDLTDQLQDNVSRRLKNSLSKTLTRFYPLAGQIEGISIDCNDKGALFTEACIDILLSDYLRNLDTNSLKVFLPTIAPGESPESWPLLSVKVSYFGSGSGFAVGVCISHKICDAASLSTFLRAWAATSKGDSNDESNTPRFPGTAIYPPPDISTQGQNFDSLAEKTKCITNRFVFESSKIAELKTVAASESVPAPTRVEAIVALIWRCAINALRSNLNVPRSSLMIQIMDLRLRIPSTDLSRDAIGNLQTAFFIKRDSSGNEMEVSEIVADFRKAKEEVNKKIKEHLESYTSTTLGLKFMGGDSNLLSEFTPNTDFYAMSSCMGMSFYEVDFGWGSPAWVGYGSHTIYDDTMYVMLMDAKDGECVEAWVAIPEQDMQTFISDQDLLSYASLNPPVLI